METKVAKLEAELRAGPHHAVLRSAQRFEHAEDRLGALIHAERKAFGHQHVTEPVDDQSGESVGFRMDDAVGVGDGVEFQNPAPQIDGRFQSLGPPDFIRPVDPRAQQPDGDLSLRIEQPETLRRSGGVDDFDEIPRMGTGVEISQLRAEQKRMPDRSLGDNLRQSPAFLGTDRSLGEPFKRCGVRRTTGLTAA
jgi:hypothetical protein